MRYFEEYTKSDELCQGVQSKLITFREYLDWPTTITSGWSNGTGHSENSEHYVVDVEGLPCSMAVDITSKAPLWWMILCAERAGFENIGAYPEFNGLHLGIRGHDKRRWIGMGVDTQQKYIDWCINNLQGIMK